MKADELLACLIDRPCSACKFHTDLGCSKWTCVFEDKIEELPSAERKGKWININTDDDDSEQFGIYVWKCSVCGELFCCKGNYCMHCGSRNEVSEDE